jgi:hypothetical protein
MTTEASLPVDDEIEEPEAPLDQALEASDLAADPTLETAEQPVVEEIVAGAEPQTLEWPEEPQEAAAPLPVDETPPLPAADASMTEAMAAWTDALRSVERSINDASEAIRFLRATVQQMAPLWRSLGGLEEAIRGFEEPAQRYPEPQTIIEPRLAPVPHDEEEEAPGLSLRREEVAPQPERDWTLQRRKPAPREKAAVKWEEAESEWTPPAPSRPSLKPVTLVPDDTPAPYAYRVTIEDRQNAVELVQLHRALTSIPSVRNVSLLNYVNGVASLSLEATDEVQPPELENAIKKVMKRSCSVVPHESNVILIQVGD